MSFNFNYPSELTQLFSPVNKFGSSSDTFMSFDCFISNYDITGPFPSNSIFKLFLIALLPLILFGIVTLIWIFVYLIKKRWVSSFKRYIVISFISIIFLLHPKLAENSLSIFQCVEIDNNIKRVRIFTSMECYSYDHIKWCVLIGLPILIIWVILTPTIALVLLFKYYNRGENSIKRYFIILYQGLKSNRFYWEFVNSLRKVIILMSFSLLITYPPIYKIMIALIVLVVTTRLQINLNPYKDPKNNEIELFAISSGGITLASGLIYTSNDSVDSLNFIIFIVVICINTRFIIEWLYLFTLCFTNKYKFCVKIASFLSLVLFKNKDQFEKDMKNDFRTQQFTDAEKSSKKEEHKSPYKPTHKKHRKLKRRLNRKEQKAKDTPKPNDEETKRKLIQMTRDVIFEENNESSHFAQNTKGVNIKEDSISNYLSLLQDSRISSKNNGERTKRKAQQLVTPPHRKSSQSDEYDFVYPRKVNSTQRVAKSNSQNKESPTINVNAFPMMSFEESDGLQDFKSSKLAHIRIGKHEEFKQSWQESPINENVSVAQRLAQKFKKLSEVVYDAE